jgi:VIT1/CCC1 family predicted Fe2+/Mn2+ transporter
MMVGAWPGGLVGVFYAIRVIKIKRNPIASQAAASITAPSGSLSMSLKHRARSPGFIAAWMRLTPGLTPVTASIASALPTWPIALVNSPSRMLAASVTLASRIEKVAGSEDGTAMVVLKIKVFMIL